MKTFGTCMKFCKAWVDVHQDSMKLMRPIELWRTCYRHLTRCEHEKDLQASHVAIVDHAKWDCLRARQAACTCVRVMDFVTSGMRKLICCTGICLVLASHARDLCRVLDRCIVGDSSRRGYNLSIADPLTRQDMRQMHSEQQS